MKTFLAASSCDPNNLVGCISPPSGFGKFSSNPQASIGDLLSVALQLFFILAGVTALVFLLRGSFDWITSGGEKEKIQAAQQRIQNAIAGLLVLFIILGIIWSLENVVFGRAFCFGLTCSIQLPQFK